MSGCPVTIHGLMGPGRYVNVPGCAFIGYCSAVPTTPDPPTADQQQRRYLPRPPNTISKNHTARVIRRYLCPGIRIPQLAKTKTRTGERRWKQGLEAEDGMAGMGGFEYCIIAFFLSPIIPPMSDTSSSPRM